MSSPSASRPPIAIERDSLAVFLSCAVVVAAMFWAFHWGLRSPISWLPAGVAAITLVRWGSHRWPWAAAGIAVGGLVASQPWYGIPAGTLATLSGPWLLARLLEAGNFQRHLERPKDILQFVAAAWVCMLIPPAVTAGAIFVLDLPWSAGHPLDTFLRWWFTASVCLMALGPGLICATRESLAEVRAKPQTYLLIALMVAVGVVALSIPTGVRGLVVAPAGIMLVLAAGILVNLTLSSMIAVGVIAIATMASLLYPAAAPETILGLARVWAFAFVIATLNLTVHALLAARRASERWLRDAEATRKLELLEASHQEQARLGRDMHDALGQELTALSLLTCALESRVAAQAPLLLDDTRNVAAAAVRAAHCARDIARGLMPLEAHAGDIAPALQSLAGRVLSSTSMRLVTRLESAAGVNACMAETLYRIAQEALNNVLKHAGAATVWVTLERRGEAVVLRIEDDGRGFPSVAGHAHSGLGIQSMRRRAELIGAELTLEPRETGGTRVTCTVALRSSIVSA